MLAAKTTATLAAANKGDIDRLECIVSPCGRSSWTRLDDGPALDGRTLPIFGTACADNLKIIHAGGTPPPATGRCKIPFPTRFFRRRASDAPQRFRRHEADRPPGREQ